MVSAARRVAVSSRAAGAGVGRTLSPVTNGAHQIVLFYKYIERDCKQMRSYQGQHQVLTDFGVVGAGLFLFQ